MEMAGLDGGVIEEVAKIGGETDEEDGEGDGGSAASNEGVAVAQGVGGVVA